jgi:hypothetical protein
MSDFKLFKYSLDVCSTEQPHDCQSYAVQDEAERFLLGRCDLFTARSFEISLLELCNLFTKRRKKASDVRFAVEIRDMNVCHPHSLS